jgi:putative hydrolase of the HAD superfamily
LLDIPKHRIDILKHLKDKYKLVLLSNTNEIHLNEIYNYMQHEFGEDVLTPNFHHCYYSQEIGMRKPDAEIYEFVTHQQNLIPTETLFLDDKEENLIASQKIGWQTFHVNFNKLSINDLQFLL